MPGGSGAGIRTCRALRRARFRTPLRRATLEGAPSCSTKGDRHPIGMHDERSLRRSLPIKAGPEAGQAGGEVLLLSFWASCRFSDDALQVAFGLTDELAGMRKNQESGEQYAGTGPRAGDGCRRHDGNDASGDTRHTHLGLENGPLELTCPPGVVHVRTMQSDIR